MNGFRHCSRILLILLTAIITTGCSSLKKRGFEKKVTRVLEMNRFGEHFTGLMVYDPAKADTLLMVNGDKYFTPASNTKIFTLFTSLKILGDSVPALKYISSGDTLFFSGTGNPSPFHPYFRDSSVVHLLKGFEHLVYVPAYFAEGRFGPGWAWEDFDSSFSPERSSFPLYGNVVRISIEGGLISEPFLFRDSILVSKHDRNRDEGRNYFYFDPDRRDTLEVPFITSDRLSLRLLGRALEKEIHLGDSFPAGEKKVFMGATPADSLYRRLMQESDNFIAEQLLMVSASALSDSLSPSLSRDFVLETYLSGIRYKPRWVDGSGLSRYNLFTPSSTVYVLEKLLEEKGKEWVFGIFPSGGRNGTLQEWFPGDPESYIYAKSGTLGNTYCLSGYLICASGRLLIFSFMNNHYLEPTSRIKTRMQDILEEIRDSY
ncbi:D-alanyl-D-alanine carboxypeptidase / D-alanyl-D-alanine-endopeptidase (penicillin-binding protein 4) [Muriicola jejuensis]|uniref:D-alanyl-D-alanine carboxypeptidase n=1 Tax=Muriicola jejuensis TaxID=504488 RepID=A0A6P0UG93_9FLAO|nr:D-alanyl-D-alanine carboxypeptidase [Muriicola jejuensis]NER10909.1 D-alanyl-D-alanine carboxypeptidase [Muriicola jejuensis]SMP15701.1 D-alanyl-D-alanine carboxypeptidase / D-alanyl-D-alanine-endopeptidase (penicillin-binding protein 4) [Muriicola jejuensis]